MYYFNKIMAHLSNWWEYIKEHLVRIVFILFIFIGLGVLFYFLPKENIMNNGSLQEQHIIIFGITLENWSKYASIVAIAIGAIWAIYQFDKNISRKQQEKGAEISKLVSQELLFKCTILGNVIIKSQLDEMFGFSNLTPSTFKNFDKSELLQFFNGQDEITNTIKRAYSSPEIQQIYFRYLETIVSQNSYDDLSCKIYNDEAAKKLFILDNTVMPFQFSQLVSSVLNDLEYISMFIASQSTDSKYIYQSLHQFFIRTIKLLAPIICVQNKDFSDKYYTNIIHVYNSWCQLRSKDLKREEKNKKKVNKLLNPKIKTV